MAHLPKSQLPSPPVPTSVPTDFVGSGQLIPPIDRIKIFSASQWEEFVLEWAHSLKNQYGNVERCGGARDMGRDVIATSKDDTNLWDNYQCKHYQRPIQPSDIWVELGKLVYYTYNHEYSYPRRYYFVAPQGAGTSLAKRLKSPNKLRDDLIKNWDTHCLTGITSIDPVKLDDNLKIYINKLDFSIFEALPPLRIIDQHRKTPWYIYRFGGGLPERPSPGVPPSTPTANEVNYVRQLLNAYSDHLKKSISQTSELVAYQEILDHFNDSRIEFYSAESLRAFSRDTLPQGEFEKLQDEIHSGIKDEARKDHNDGYQRVMAVVGTARSLQITGHALISRLHLRDRGGICHQLANDNKVWWVK